MAPSSQHQEPPLIPGRFNQLISIEEAARRRLSVSRERVRQILKKGLIESYPLSGWDKVFVLRDEVDGYHAWSEKEKG